MSDKKHKKRLKREAKKKKEKKLAQDQQQKIRNQMGMFDRLPKSCSACDKVFPKTREAHMTWKVTVRNKEQQVRLFCPDCLDKAKQLVEGEENEQP
jgi:flagellar motor protein MotB